MNKIMFENKYFRSEKNKSKDTIVTILKDDYKFQGIDMTNCRLITSRNGVITDEYTDSVITEIYNRYDNQKDRRSAFLELRCKTLNTLLCFL